MEEGVQVRENDVCQVPDSHETHKSLVHALRIQSLCGVINRKEIHVPWESGLLGFIRKTFFLLLLRTSL